MPSSCTELIWRLRGNVQDLKDSVENKLYGLEKFTSTFILTPVVETPKLSNSPIKNLVSLTFVLDLFPLNNLKTVPPSTEVFFFAQLCGKGIKKDN